jgi:peptide/nickel transport system permease protein
MRRYVLRRLIHGATALFGISVLVFAMLHLIPGDPVDHMFRDASLTAEARALIRHDLGLDAPLHTQYLRFLARALQGDLGQAIFIHRPVTRMLADELPYTVRLAALALLLTIAFGLAFGVAAALSANSWLDGAIMAVAVSGLSIPSYWLGLLVILVFSVKLGWLPLLAGESLVALMAPAFVLAFRASAIVSRMVRAGLLEVLNQDFIRTARAKGIAEHGVVGRHALRNALIPVITVVGLQLGQLLGGAVIVETVFARRGIGTLTVNAILQRDFPLAQGTVLFVGTVYILTNVMVDLLYGYVDPRIRYADS